jgi:hypothetical protein
MAVMKKAGLVLALAGIVAAQSSSVVNVFLPGADSQTLLGSIIKSVCYVTPLDQTGRSLKQVLQTGFLEDHDGDRMPNGRRLGRLRFRRSYYRDRWTLDISRPRIL